MGKITIEGDAIQIKDHWHVIGIGLVCFNLMNEFEHITLIDTSYGMIDKLNEKIEQYKLNERGK